MPHTTILIDVLWKRFYIELLVVLEKYVIIIGGDTIIKKILLEFRNELSVIVTGVAILLFTSLKTHQIHPEIILAAIFLMIVQYICLIMVQPKRARMDIEIQSFLTIFTWVLYIPIFVTSAEYLVNPSLFYFIRFCAIVELSYVLITVCVIATVNYQSKKQAPSKKEILGE